MIDYKGTLNIWQSFSTLEESHLTTS